MFVVGVVVLMDNVVSICSEMTLRNIFYSWWVSSQIRVLILWTPRSVRIWSSPTWWGFPVRDYQIPDSCHARFWVFFFWLVVASCQCHKPASSSHLTCVRGEDSDWGCNLRVLWTLAQARLLSNFFSAVWSTLIGRGSTRLGSHWSRWFRVLLR